MAAIEDRTGRGARTREDWQELDREHHLHPFTDHKDLHQKRSRIIARVDLGLILGPRRNEMGGPEGPPKTCVRGS